jgi:hypothetical protein
MTRQKELIAAKVQALIDAMPVEQNNTFFNPTFQPQ